MVRFTYKKYGIQIEQQWFTNNIVQAALPKTKVLIVHGIDDIDVKAGVGEQLTLWTDLTVSEDVIHSSFRKNTKYEIRRADKEGATYKAYFGKEITEELIDGFGEVYEKMYRSKGISQGLNKNLMRACVEEECIAITVCCVGGEPLAYHSYLYDESNARLYQSCSLFRESPEEAKTVGIVNRGLHWYDIKLFKSRGAKLYDWGGIVSVDNPNGIDQFKIGFGGVPHTYYNATIPVGIIGKGIVLAKRLLH